MSTSYKPIKRNIIILLLLFSVIILCVGSLFGFSQDDILSRKGESAPEAITIEEKITDEYKSPEEILYEYAGEHGYSIEDYPEKLIKLINKEPESLGFVLDYPEKAGEKKKVRLGKIDYDKVPLFIQWDTRWGYAPYGNGVIGLDGCGPTCLSMAAVYFLHDRSMTPDYIASYAADNGYYMDGVGTVWSLFGKGADALGLNCSEISNDKNSMISALDDGKIIICSVGPGDFTVKGHFILVTGYEDDGFSVNDPNSYNNSQKLWRFKKLSPQIKNMWAVSKK